MHLNDQLGKTIEIPIKKEASCPIKKNNFLLNK
jgi:hypothetical protein